MVVKTRLGMGKIEFLFLVNTLLVFILLFSLFTFSVNAVVGRDNVTVKTNLTVGNVAPEVLNVTIVGDGTFDLTPNATTMLTCLAWIRDYNNETDFDNVNATFFDATNSFLDDVDSNNFHYTNSSCDIDLDALWEGFDDIYHAVANCTFEVEYYAYPGNWNCTVFVNDSTSLVGSGTSEVYVNPLLALGLPDYIDYGIINATEVSSESIANVTNYGNVLMNLSLEGYAQTRGDDLAMNCSLGNIGVIPIYYEKYNLTDSNDSVITLSEFEGVYANLSSDPVVREFNLNLRHNDLVNDAFNSTYWRIYVPIGVAGTCEGRIIFGATQGVGVPY